MSQDAVVWNLAYTVTGKRAIFGVFNLWCTLNHVNVKINRICEPLLGPSPSQQHAERCT